MNQLNHIAIIGSGITGLAAAYYAKEAGAHVTLIEAQDRLGGKIKTIHRVHRDGPRPFLSDVTRLRSRRYDD